MNAGEFRSDTERALFCDDNFNPGPVCIVRGISGSARVVERSHEQNEATASQEDGRDSCPKHTFCPSRHVLLGFQIVYLTLFLALVLLANLRSVSGIPIAVSFLAQSR